MQSSVVFWTSEFACLWKAEKWLYQIDTSASTRDERRSKPGMGRIFSHCVWQPKTIAGAFRVARHNNSVAAPFIFESHCAYFMGACLSLCDVSQKSVRGISRYPGICKEGYTLCMNWRLDFTQTNLLLFGYFRKGFIAHSFCKWPLYTLQSAKRK